jgi:hypothetical protein
VSMRLSGLGLALGAALFFFASGRAEAQCICPNNEPPCKCEMVEGQIESICCAGGRICIDQECKQSPPFCLNDEDCGPGRSCTDDHRCTCSTNADCGEGLLCSADKVCVDTCNGGAACDEGQVCSSVTRKCEHSCEVDSDCELSRCLEDIGHCAAEGVCTTNFHCRKFDGVYGGLPWICGPEGLCTTTPNASEMVACTCSLGAGVGGVLVPASLVALGALALLGRARRLRARSRGRAAGR